jgi:NAD(P)H-hydrate epimerase
MKILTAQQMRELDRLTVERCGIPDATLMETAGSRVVEAIIEHYGSVAGKTFVVLCGKGNNGGDGAVVARHLWMRKAKVKVTLWGRLDEVQGDARANLETIRKLAESALLLFSDEEQQYHPDMYHLRIFPNRPDFIVDAFLGTGLTRPIEGRYAGQVSSLAEYVASGNTQRTKVISVDIPSGLSSDSGQLIGSHIKADLTVTFTAPKIGNVLPPACHANGKLVIASIGTPEGLIEEESCSQVELIEEKQIVEFLNASRRAPDAHKGSVGDVLLIAGSRGKTGAAALAAEAVLRAGAGLVTVAIAQSAQSLLVTQTRTEVMTEPLAETGSGAIAHDALKRAIELGQKRTVIALGPGLSSTDESTRSFVREFVAQRNAPLVIDADGLNCLAPWPEELKGSEELPIIITPHPGEMARLTGKTNAEIVADRISAAREFAAKHHVITVLKGSRTVIAAPVRIMDVAGYVVDVYVNPTGNAGMATAGSGDVLTGLIAGLLAQRPRSEKEEVINPVAQDAVISAVYLHGLAGDIAASEIGMRSMLAGDISDRISAAILRTGGDAEKG